MSVSQPPVRTGETAGASPDIPDARATVPDAVAPPPRHPRFPLFDGLRAIAVLAVLGAHLPTRDLPHFLQRFAAHLSVGVVIFFVVSGFLLYRPFIAARAGGAASPAVGDYAKRRFLRIYPAYWLVLTVLTILPGTVGVQGSNPVPQYALVQTLPVAGGPTCTVLCDLGQTWSLVAEVTFYTLLPLYALVALWLTRGLERRTWMRVELGILAVLAAVSVFFAFVSPGGGTPSPWITNTALGYWLLFAIGMGLAVASVVLGGGERQPALLRMAASNPIVPWLIAIAAYVALCFWLPLVPFNRTDRLVSFVGFGLVAALVVLPAVFGDGRTGLPRRVLAHPLIAWIGLISYGIFLWHFAIAEEIARDMPYVLALVVTLALSVAVAAVSYYVVERPILRFKYRRFRDLFGHG
ncbi:MAG: acyltransferase family protein [Solirubrobacterales bacterium]